MKPRLFQYGAPLSGATAALNRVVASALVLAQIAAMAPAQSLFMSGRQSGRVRLEQYLSLAEAQTQEGRWTELSEKGLAAAIAAWESLTLYEREADRGAWLQEREAAVREFSMTADAAYASWFCDRFFAETGEIRRTDFALELREKAASWLFDDGTGGTRYVSADKAGAAMSAWEQQVAGVVFDEYMREWDAAHSVLYADVRNRLEEKGIDSELALLVVDLKAGDHREYVAREFALIAGREENTLMSVLLYDTQSLQRKSEAEAARIIASEVAAAARSRTEHDMDALFRSLSTTIEAEDVLDVAIADGGPWLDQFRTAFEKGLAEWENAEQTFLASRALWEQNAAETFLDGQQAWSAALGELREKKLAWTREIQEKLRVGEAQWRDEGNRLGDMLQQAREEFTSAAEKEQEQLSKNMRSHLALYEQSRQMMALAVEGAEIWFDHYGEKYGGKFSLWKTDDLNSWDPGEGHVGELQYWQDLYHTYENSAQMALEKLYSLSAGVFTDTGAFAYLSELEVELLKAKAVKRYWDNEVAIAKAVDDYVGKTSADKEIGAETLAALKNAQVAYNTAVDAYNRELEKLGFLADDLDGASETLSAKVAALQDLRKTLGEKQTEYRALSEILKGVDDKELKQRVLKLLETRNTPVDTGVKQTFFDAADAYSAALFDNNLASLAAYLLNSGGPGGASLAEITAARKKAEGFADEPWSEAAYMVQKVALDDLPETAGKTALEKTAAILESPASTAEEKAEALAAWKTLWGEVAAFWADSAAQIEGTVSFLTTGETGFEAKLSALETELAALEAEALKASPGVSPDPEASEKLKAAQGELEKLRKLQEACTQMYVSYTTKYADERNFRGATEVFSLMEGTDLAALTSSQAAIFLRPGGTEAALTPVFAFLEALSSKGRELSAGGQAVLEKYQEEVLELLSLQLVHGPGGSAEKLALVSGEQALAELDAALQVSLSEARAVESEKAAAVLMSVKDEADWLLQQEALAALELREARVEAALRELSFRRKLAEKVTRELAVDRVSWHQGLAAFELTDPALRGSAEQTEAASSLLGRDGVTVVASELLSSLEEYAGYFRRSSAAPVSMGKTTLTVDLEKYRNEAYEPEEQRGQALKTAARELNRAAGVLASDSQEAWSVEEALGTLLFTLEKNHLDGGSLRAELAKAEEALKNAEAALATEMTVYTGAAEAVQNAAEAHNRQLSAVTETFDKSEEAKLSFRKAQGVYDWATSVYLAGFGKTDGGAGGASAAPVTPKEALFAAEFSASRAALAVTVLTNLAAGKTDEITDLGMKGALDTYERSMTAHYRGLATAAVAEAEIARQKELVAAAENAEAEALAALVKERVSAAIEDTHLRLVNLVKTGDTFTVSLNNGTAPGIDSAMYRDYFFSETVDDPLVTNPGHKKTAAASEALIWLREVTAKGPAYLDDLGLAFLYLRATASREDIMEDIFQDSGVKLIDTLHNTSVAAQYQKYAKDELRKAYEKVTKDAGSEADLARYILYRDTNLADTFAVGNRERTVLEERALDRMADYLEAQAGVHRKTTGSLAAAAAASTAAAVALAFGGQFIPAAAAAAAAAGLALAAKNEGDIARDLGDYGDEMDRLRKSRRAKVSAQNDTDAGNYAAYLECSADLAAKRAVLADCLGETVDGKSLSYEEFRDSVIAIFENADSGSDNDLAISAASAFTVLTRTAFDAARAGESKNTLEAIARINAHLAAQETAAKTGSGGVDERAEMLREKQAAFRREFQEILGGALTISASDAESLRDLSLKASDLSLSLEERNAASADYDSLAQKIITASNNAEVQRTLASRAAGAFGTNAWTEKAFDQALIAYNRRLWDTHVNRDGMPEDYALNIIERGIDDAILALAHAQASQLEAKKTDWAMSVQQFTAQKAAWDSQIAAILGVGMAEWNRAEGTLWASQKTWEENFSAAYYELVDEWNDNYYNFLEEKDDWMLSQYTAAAGKGSASLLASAGVYDEKISRQAAADALATAKNRAPDRMSSLVSAVNAKVEGIFASSGLAELLAGVGAVNLRAENAAAPVLRGVARSSSNLRGSADALTALSTLREERKAVNSRLAAAEVQLQLDAARDGFKKRLAAENRAMTVWETNLVQEYGYTVGADISRRQLVKSTWSGNVFETQKVHRYEDFAAGEVPMATRLDDSHLAGLDSDTVMYRISRAQQEFSRWRDDVFGAADDDGEIKRTLIRGAAGDAEAVYERDGKLGAHIGYAALLKADADISGSKNNAVEKAGKGELGAILLDFSWNQMISNAGLAMLSAASYDKPLWDDSTTGAFKAPSLRVVLDIANDMLGTIAGGVLGKIIQYSDDVLLAALDIGGGYKTPKEIAEQAVSKFIAAEIGQIGGTVLAGAGGIGAGIANTGTRITTNAAIGAGTAWAQAAFNGTIHFDRDKVFDLQGFVENTKNGIGSIVTGGVMGALGAANGYDSNGYYLNGAVFGTSDIHAFNALLGGLAGNAADYAINGKITFNAAKAFGVNFWEVGYDKNNGGLFTTIGRGGTSVTPADLASALAGFNEGAKVTAWKTIRPDKGATLNAINMLAWDGDGTDLGLAQGIWDGDIGVSYKRMGDNVLGARAKDGGSLIINDKFLRTDGVSGAEQAAQIASLLSHENAHGNPYAVELYARESGYATYARLKAVFGVSGEGYERMSDIAELTEVYEAGGMSALAAAMFLNGVSSRYYERSTAWNNVGDADNALVKTGKNVYNGVKGFLQSAADFFGIHPKSSRDSAVGDALPNYGEIDPYDYYFTAVHSTGERQTDGTNAQEPLGGSLSLSEVAAYNALGREQINFYSIAAWGCALGTVVDMAYSITGEKISYAEASRALRDAGYFAGNGDAKNQQNLIFAEEAINHLSGASVVSTALTMNRDAVNANRQAALDALMNADRNQTAGFMARVQVPGLGGNSHFVTLSVLNYTEGAITSFTALDPWNGERTYDIAALRGVKIFTVKSEGISSYMKSWYKYDPPGT